MKNLTQRIKRIDVLKNTLKVIDAPAFMKWQQRFAQEVDVAI